MIKQLTAFCLALLSITAYSQNELQQAAIPPLNIPMSFAGTYGELRHDHFHAGLDFKVGGVVGEPIHAIKSGYISRIAVSVSGYGNCIYINHPDGTMSVYGHMYTFRDDIARMVLREQYKKENFAVNLFFGPNDYPVKQGDVIGKVGTTGSSSGPHLHMEIRREGGNLPTNYLKDNIYSVSDDASPVIQRVAFYAYEDSTGVSQSRRLALLKTASNKVMVPAKSYIAIDAIDKMPGTSNKLAVETYQAFLDNEEFFRLDVGETDYDSQKYIQSMIAAGESGDDLIKTLVEPGNKLAAKKIKATNNGIIVLNDYEPHSLKIKVTDIRGNQSSAQYTIQRNDDIKVVEDSLMRYKLLWYTPNTYNNQDFVLSLPSGALYGNYDITLAKVADACDSLNIYSPVWKMGDSSVALHKKATLKFKNNNLPDSLRNKALIASYNEKNGSLSAIGGEWKGEQLVANVGFGTYCVALDTIPPLLYPMVKDGYQPQPSTGTGYIVPDGSEVKFRLTDSFSGISDFRVEVDGKWAIALLKSGRLTVYLDPTHHEKGSHLITVTAWDGVGNESTTSVTVNY
ncbi:MAG: peptidoglycan DD-metalloendopeptidase family protein [Bacteroidales bacterium]|nr:peptidoglycan DD-metalloendopeptidase family protein [Bacteroidales bacterium]